MDILTQKTVWWLESDPRARGDGGQLKDLVADSNPLEETESLHADLLFIAIDTVDWDAVARELEKRKTRPRD